MLCEDSCVQVHLMLQDNTKYEWSLQYMHTSNVSFTQLFFHKIMYNRRQQKQTSNYKIPLQWTIGLANSPTTSSSREIWGTMDTTAPWTIGFLGKWLMLLRLWRFPKLGLGTINILTHEDLPLRLPIYLNKHLQNTDFDTGKQITDT